MTAGQENLHVSFNQTSRRELGLTRKGLIKTINNIPRWQRTIIISPILMLSTLPISGCSFAPDGSLQIDEEAVDNVVSDITGAITDAVDEALNSARKDFIHDEYNSKDVTDNHSYNILNHLDTNNPDLTGKFQVHSVKLLDDDTIKMTIIVDLPEEQDNGPSASRRIESISVPQSLTEDNTVYYYESEEVRSESHGTFPVGGKKGLVIKYSIY